MSVSTNNAFAALRLDDDGASAASGDGKEAKDSTAKWGHGGVSWADECVGATPMRLSQRKQRCELSDSLTPADTGTPRRDGNGVTTDAADTTPLIPDMRLKEPLVWCVAPPQPGRQLDVNSAPCHLTLRRLCASLYLRIDCEMTGLVRPPAQSVFFNALRPDPCPLLAAGGG